MLVTLFHLQTSIWLLQGASHCFYMWYIQEPQQYIDTFLWVFSPWPAGVATCPIVQVFKLHNLFQLFYKAIAVAILSSNKITETICLPSHCICLATVPIYGLLHMPIWSPCMVYVFLFPSLLISYIPSCSLVCPCYPSCLLSLLCLPKFLTIADYLICI